MLAMDIKTLEEEHTALLSDKAGESEFWEGLKDQIEQVKVNTVGSFSFIIQKLSILGFTWSKPDMAFGFWPKQGLKIKGPHLVAKNGNCLIQWGFVSYGCETQLQLGKFLPSSY